MHLLFFGGERRKMYLACRCILPADRPGPRLAAVKSHKPWSSYERGRGKKKKAGHDLWLTVEVQALKRIHFFIIKTPPSVMRDTSKHFIQWMLFIEGNVSFFLLHFCLLQERSRTSAPGRDASGASPVLMSWRAISGNTPVRSLSSAVCVAAVSPAPITWPYTWRDTRARNNQVHLFTFLKRGLRY